MADDEVRGEASFGGDVSSRPERLSQIVTVWSVVRGATDPQAADRQSAQRHLLMLYGQSVRRYLTACLKDATAVDEVYQEFALKLARGDFSSADPAIGRFRGFVKSVLFRLVADHHRAKKRDRRVASFDPQEFDPSQCDPGDSSLEADETFQKIWRDGLLDRAWKGLREEQQGRGHVYYTLLKTRVDHPDWSPDQVIAATTEATGNTVAESAFRVTLHRARRRFADLLIEAVAASLGSSDLEALEQELITLDLHRYCKEALDRRRAS